MYKRIIALLTVVSVAFVACEKDLPTYEERLDAKWYVHLEVLDTYLGDELISSDSTEYPRQIDIENYIAALAEAEETEDGLKLPPPYYEINMDTTNIYWSQMLGGNGSWHVDGEEFIVFERSDLSVIPPVVELNYTVKELREDHVMFLSFENQIGSGYNRISRRLYCTKEDPIKDAYIPPAEGE